jgi:hypothetical protein
MHQGFEVEGVVALRIGVGVGVGDVFLGSVSFNLRSCGGECMCEALLGLFEGCVGVADGDCDELYLPP